MSWEDEVEGMGGVGVLATGYVGILGCVGGVRCASLA